MPPGANTFSSRILSPAMSTLTKVEAISQQLGTQKIAQTLFGRPEFDIDGCEEPKAGANGRTPRDPRAIQMR